MNRNLVRALALLAVIAAVGCSSGFGVTDVKRITDPENLSSEEVPKFTCLANSATMRLPEQFRANLPSWGTRQPDDAFVAIARSAPGGFAGLFFEDDHFVVTFVDPTAANQNRAAVQAAFDIQNYSPLHFDMSKAEFRGARWTFAELDEWLRYLPLSKVVTPISGVSSIDLDEKANTIAFGVIDETARALLEKNLADLNVSCNLVTTVIRAYAVAL